MNGVAIVALFTAAVLSIIDAKGCSDDNDCVYGTICVDKACVTVKCESSDLCKKLAGVKAAKRRCNKEKVCTRKKHKSLTKLSRSPGSKCRYNEECDRNEICSSSVCQRKTCASDGDCRKFTKYPAICTGGVCTSQWCKHHSDCPEKYGCYEDRVMNAFLISSIYCTHLFSLGKSQRKV